MIKKIQKVHFPTTYEADSMWSPDIIANRILLPVPSHFEQYPISQQSIDFVFSLSENIKNIRVYTGEFQPFKKEFNPDYIRCKEHPLNRHFEGKEESSDWIFKVNGYNLSFFSFWKKCKKKITF